MACRPVTRNWSEIFSTDEICTICSEPVNNSNKATAKLICGHFFHLCCIGCVFNLTGVMRCPNCGTIEETDWLYTLPPGNGEDIVADEAVDNVLQRPPNRTYRHVARNPNAAARDTSFLNGLSRESHDLLANGLNYFVVGQSIPHSAVPDISGLYAHANRIINIFDAVYQAAGLRPRTSAYQQPPANLNGHGMAAAGRNVRPRTSANQSPASHGLVAAGHNVRPETSAYQPPVNPNSHGLAAAGHNVRPRTSAYQPPANPNSHGLASTASNSSASAVSNANASASAGTDVSLQLRLAPPGDSSDE